MNKLARGLATSINVRLINVSILEGSREFNKVIPQSPNQIYRSHPEMVAQSNIQKSCQLSYMICFLFSAVYIYIHNICLFQDLTS